jgi:PAS domain S-box-containing protein
VGIEPDGRIVLVNTQTGAIFGYERAELLGRQLELLVPERFRGVHRGHRDGYFGHPRTRPMGADLELFGRRRDGTEFPAEISLSCIDTESGVLAIAAIRDVTERVVAQQERKRLEAEIENARRAEEEHRRESLETQLNQLRRLESVGQLAGGIAHDFNNILGVILNYSQFVADELPEGSQARDDIEEIRRAAERATALTRQLLIFSRREVVNKRVLDLNDVLADIDKLLRRAIGEHIELETERGAALWSVEADAGQIEQVLVNLAVNARDAMPGGGRLVIETSNLHLDETISEFGEPMSEGRYVRLAVSDSGVGMDAEVRSRVFEPFFTTKPPGQGTGLGLTTVYGIVKEAGGSVRIYSEIGLGTTVKVYLPATAETPVQAVTELPPPSPQARGETVLLVEDEDGVRRLARRILERAGYRVLDAEGGIPGLDICERPDEPIDLLLTDVVMPGMLGPELADRAQAARPGLRVLFMSGYVHQVLSEIKSSHSAGLDLVEKPFTAETLLTRVRAALDASPEPPEPPMAA